MELKPRQYIITNEDGLVLSHNPQTSRLMWTEDKSRAIKDDWNNMFNLYLKHFSMTQHHGQIKITPVAPGQAGKGK